MKKNNARKPPGDLKRFTLRLPIGLYMKIEERARKNKRSVAGECEVLLERHVDAIESYTSIPPKPAAGVIGGR